MLPEIEIPGPARALRTSAPFSWFWMKLRNQVLSQSFGIESVLALVMPGFEMRAVMLPLAVFDFSGHADRKRRGRVRHTELHHQAVVLSEVPPYRAVAGVARHTERLRVVSRYVIRLPPVVREQEADARRYGRGRAGARGHHRLNPAHDLAVVALVERLRRERAHDRRVCVPKLSLDGVVQVPDGAALRVADQLLPERVQVREGAVLHLLTVEHRHKVEPLLRHAIVSKRALRERYRQNVERVPVPGRAAGRR